MKVNRENKGVLKNHPHRWFSYLKTSPLLPFVSNAVGWIMPHRRFGGKHGRFEQ